MEDLKKIKTRIDWLCQHKVNAFSPTISPAPKSAERNEIESIYEAVLFYLKRGVNDFIFQKKYMGSYCDIYLCKNLEDTYFVSRNGHKIHYIDRDAALLACEQLHVKFDWTQLSLVIIQSELLPWGVLGQGLIENEFSGYLNAHQNHLNYLQQSNLYDKLESVTGSETYIKYIEDSLILNPKEMRAKYPSHIIRQYASIKNFNQLNLDAYKQGVDVYEKQIAHFGTKHALHFKPFNILKKIYNDGREEIINSNLSYMEVNDDEFLTLNIHSVDELDSKLKTVYSWFNTLSSEMDEGIMIKPYTAFISKLPPAFKVRNDQYLTMIYGVDFLNEYKSNLGKRTIRRKLECSINDWMINWELLQTTYNKINVNNYAYKNLLLDRILGEQIENNLDHRL